MDALSTIKSLESGTEFKAWKKDNSKAYLASAFAMFSEKDERQWLISYFSKEKGIMTTFSSQHEVGHEEPFSRTGNIAKLEFDEVRVDDDAAMKAASEALEENYKGETIQKTIMVLQRLNSKALWNITFVTPSFKVVNIKISATTETSPVMRK